MTQGDRSGPGSTGLRIRARRTVLGLTLAQVAERAGLSIAYVSNLEQGRGNPTLEALRSVAAALQQTPGELLGEARTEEAFDPTELILAQAPNSLRVFIRSDRFATAVKRLSGDHTAPDEMSRRLMVAMASAPRRSTSEPRDEDWRRLLDVYSLILSDDE